MIKCLGYGCLSASVGLIIQSRGTDVLSSLEGCSGLISHRKFSAPAASRWWWVGLRVHTRSSSRELDIGRAHIPPLLKVVHEQPTNQQPRYQPMAVAKSCCPSGERACTHPSYLAHALCVNKLFHKQRGFGHRAILIFGDRDVAGGFKQNTTPSSTR